MHSLQAQQSPAVAQDRNRGWSNTSLGRYVISVEAEMLAKVLPKLYGPSAALLGNVDFSPYLDEAQMPTRILALDTVPAAGVDYKRGLVASAESLPFDTKSLALLILPHVLEFSDDPHRVLREVERVLVPEGHVVILGFNPLSLWGVRRLISRRPRNPLWAGRFLTLARLRDWLGVLDFEATAGQMGGYRPPIRSARARAHFRFMDKTGDRWWPLLGAIYLVVARKREPGITPIVASWKAARPLAPGLVEPVARRGQ